MVIRCKHCNGSVLYVYGNCLEPSMYKCLHCGSETNEFGDVILGKWAKDFTINNHINNRNNDMNDNDLRCGDSYTKNRRFIFEGVIKQYLDDIFGKI